jgi:apolipoprotein D and lipocalin family protein
MKKHWLASSALASSLLLTGCATVAPPPTVPRVELDRFMGDWYVLGGILTPFEKGAHNAVETYALDEQGRIPTTYTFRKGGFDGPLKRYDNMAFVHNRETFAEWRIQFFWPLKFPYLVVYLDPDYQVTAVGTDDRDYLWIMARDWNLPEARYQEVIQRVAELGFDTNRMVRVPQDGKGK